MHLFGDDTSQPHLRHFHAQHHGSSVELHWDVRNAPPLKWRVLRSQEGFAATADVPQSDQVVVMEGSGDHVMDDNLPAHENFFYTVFCENEQGVWQCQAEVKVKPHDVLHWWHPKAEEHLEIERDLEANSIHGPFRAGGIYRTPATDIATSSALNAYRGQAATGQLAAWLTLGK